MKAPWQAPALPTGVAWTGFVRRCRRARSTALPTLSTARGNSGPVHAIWQGRAWSGGIQTRDQDTPDLQRETGASVCVQRGNAARRGVTVRGGSALVRVAPGLLAPITRLRGRRHGMDDKEDTRREENHAAAPHRRQPGRYTHLQADAYQDNRVDLRWSAGPAGQPDWAPSSGHSTDTSSLSLGERCRGPARA